MCTYARVGAFTVAGEDGQPVAFFPFQVGLTYVDEVTHLFLLMSKSGAIGSVGAQMSWLRWRDEQVRTMMARLITGEKSAGQALQEAWATLRYKWDMADACPATATPTTLTTAGNAFGDDQNAEVEQPQSKRPRTSAPVQRGGSSGSQGKGEQNQQSRIWPRKDKMHNLWLCLSYHPKGNKKICGKFNSKQGCSSGSSCARGLHVCSVRMGDKEICGHQSHGAFWHR